MGAFLCPNVWMVRIHTHIRLCYDVGLQGADFVFNLQAAHTAQQRVVQEQLNLQPFWYTQEAVDPVTHNRLLRLKAPPMSVRAYSKPFSCGWKTRPLTKPPPPMATLRQL